MPSASTPPLVALYLVKCEDLEHYRAGAKARLAAWVERMNAARIEWMVLYVPLGTRARAGGGGANHSVYKKIFDKIRADFAHKRPSFNASSSSNASMSSGSTSSAAPGCGGSSSGPGTPGGALAGASERICKIEILEGNSVVGGAPGQQQQHESQWSELLLRLRHCIMDAFQVQCYKYEEQVRVLDAKVVTVVSSRLTVVEGATDEAECVRVCGFAAAQRQCCWLGLWRVLSRERATRTHVPADVLAGRRHSPRAYRLALLCSSSSSSSPSSSLPHTTLLRVATAARSV